MNWAWVITDFGSGSSSLSWAFTCSLMMEFSSTGGAVSRKLSADIISSKVYSSMLRGDANCWPNGMSSSLSRTPLSSSDLDTKFAWRKQLARIYVVISDQDAKIVFIVSNKSNFLENSIAFSEDPASLAATILLMMPLRSWAFSALILLWSQGRIRLVTFGRRKMSPMFVRVMSVGCAVQLSTIKATLRFAFRSSLSHFLIHASKLFPVTNSSCNVKCTYINSLAGLILLTSKIVWCSPE